MKLKNIRDKCPMKKKEKMRHPLAFDTEGKYYRNFAKFRKGRGMKHQITIALIQTLSSI